MNKHIDDKQAWCKYKQMKNDTGTFSFILALIKLRTFQQILKNELVYRIITVCVRGIEILYRIFYHSLT